MFATRGQRKRVTLKDIAEKTGFTVNTVSRALRDKDDISIETKELIRNTAKEMNYINDVMAGALRSRKTKTIAIILGDISNPHFGIMAKEIEIGARKHHYNTLVINTEEDNSIEQQAIYMALSKNVDGIILCPTQKNYDNIRLLQEHGTPFVLCGRRIEEASIDYVICDDRSGGYLATNHLLSLGCTRILFLNGPTYISSAAERLAGYQQALIDYQIEPSKELIRTVSVKSGQCSKVIKRVIDAGVSFTGIFAFSDMIAYEAICALYEKGIQVPQDVKIVGFDDIQAKLFVPFPLTSIGAKSSMARKAVDVLFKIIKGDHKDQYYHEVIETNLVVRASTATTQG